MRADLEEDVLASWELQRARDGATVRVAGLVVARQRPATAKGVTFMLLEDEHGTINLVVPPPVHDRCRLAVRAEPFVLGVESSNDEGVINVVVTAVQRLDHGDVPPGQIRYIELQRTWSTEDVGRPARGGAERALLGRRISGSLTGARLRSAMTRLTAVAHTSRPALRRARDRGPGRSARGNDARRWGVSRAVVVEHHPHLRHLLGQAVHAARYFAQLLVRVLPAEALGRLAGEVALRVAAVRAQVGEVSSGGGVDRRHDRHVVARWGVDAHEAALRSDRYSSVPSTRSSRTHPGGGAHGHRPRRESLDQGSSSSSRLLGSEGRRELKEEGSQLAHRLEGSDRLTKRSASDRSRADVSTTRPRPVV